MKRLTPGVAFTVFVCLLLPAILPPQWVGASSPIESLRAWLALPLDQRANLQNQAFAFEKLAKDQAKQACQMLWDDHVSQINSTRKKEWDDKVITIGQHSLKLLEKQFGQRPKNGWNLFISMHGGGNAAPAVNDQQWQNQIKLYQPANSLYICPRAPTNSWNLWHQDHIDGLFDRLIEDAIVLGQVDPNHVYLMGYSAGGDGVYQLAPRMADRWAAASMMAGHPNDASPLGLRNLPFAIHVGALDNGYGRNRMAIAWSDKLRTLQKDDPTGYIHLVKLHEGRAHWMNLEDAEAVDWMESFTRNPTPDKVVWMQGNKTHNRFYWLAALPGEAKKGQLIVASRHGQNIDIEKAESVKTITILLNDAMIDLDQPITIRAAGKKRFEGLVARTIAEIQSTLAERGDPGLIFAAHKTIQIESIVKRP